MGAKETHVAHRSRSLAADVRLFWWQVMIIPISQASRAYAEAVRRSVRAAHFFVDCDHGDNKMEKKVRDAQLEQYNYILVSIPWEPGIRQCTLDPQAALTSLGDQTALRWRPDRVCGRSAPCYVDDVLGPTWRMLFLSVGGSI